MAFSIGGQITVSSTAAALSSVANNVETLLIKAFPGNAANVFIGEIGVTTSTGYVLAPGEEFAYTPSNGNLNRMPKTNSVYVVGTASDKVSWLATLR